MPAFQQAISFHYLWHRMKLLDVVLFSLAVAFTIIGIYEIVTEGIGYAYGYVMLSLVFYFLYSYRKKHRR